MDSGLIKPAAQMPKSFQISMPSGPNGRCINQISSVHPLKNSEENYAKNQQNLQMAMLRRREGLYAPLIISMELHAAQKIGRLPFLTSSNAQRDALLGTDESIEFSDFLGTEDTVTDMRYPHVTMEKSLGIL